MKIKSLMFGMMVFFSMVQAVPASSVDFVRTDNYTIDRLSGLDWLDLKVTAGRSYNDVANDANLAAAGWHYASVNQLSQMVNDYTGIPVDLSSANQLASNPAGSIFVVTGYTGSWLYGGVEFVPGTNIVHGGYYMAWDAPEFYAFGITADSDSLTANSHKSVQFHARPLANLLLWYPSSNLDSRVDSLTGSFLIRNSQNLAAVPLPPTIYLMAIGLCGLFRKTMSWG